MGNEVQIILRAIDKASGEINKVTGAGNKLSAGFQSLTGFSLSAAGGIAAAGAAAGAIIKILKESVEETIAYATEIDNMSRLLGLDTEETSRLVQASDDLFISQEKLKAGLQAATRQGIDVSIEGLKELSAQYLALPEGVERSEFVLKTFGRSGAEMGKLMEVGADGIDEATAAIADNLIVTKESMANAMDYKRSLDNLDDSWQGVKYTIGTEAVRALDLLLRNLTKGTDDTEAFREAEIKLKHEIEAVNAQVLRSEEWKKANTAPLQAELDALRDSYYGVGDAATDAAAITEEEFAKAEAAITQVSEAYITGVGVWQSMQDNHTKSMKENKSSIEDVKEELAKLNALPYLSEEQKGQINALNGQLGDLEQKQKDIMAAAVLKTQTVILGYMQEQLAAVGGLTTDETEWLIAKGVEWGIYSETAVQAYKDAQAAADEFLEHRNAAEGDKTVNVHYKVTVDEPEGTWWHGATGEGVTETARAAGGPVYKGRPYLVGEHGAEGFIPKEDGTIVPHDQLNRGGGSAMGTQSSGRYLGPSAREIGDAVAVALIRKGAIG